MRYFVLFAIGCVCLAQAPNGSTRSQRREFDANGAPVSGGTLTQETRQGGGYSRSDMMTTVNGALAPQTKIEERVIRQDANGKVVERLVRHYDQDGNPGPSEKIQIEERRDGRGGRTTSTTLYRADLNGNMSVAERSTTQANNSAGRTSSSTQVERVSPDGSLRLAERSSTEGESAGGQKKESTVVYRVDANGDFREVKREVREATVANGKTVENRAQYFDGQLAQQEVATIVERPDGSKVTQVNVFRQNARGSATPSDGRLMLQEQQIIESKLVGKSVVQTVTSRVASVNEGGRLSEPRKIAETVCTGCSLKDPAAEADPAPAAKPVAAPVR